MSAKATAASTVTFESEWFGAAQEALRTRPPAAASHLKSLEAAGSAPSRWGWQRRTMPAALLGNSRCRQELIIQMDWGSLPQAPITSVKRGPQNLDPLRQVIGSQASHQSRSAPNVWSPAACLPAAADLPFACSNTPTRLPPPPPLEPIAWLIDCVLYPTGRG